MGDWTTASLAGRALTEWGFVLTGQSRPGAAARTSLLDVPGRDGFLDATARPGGWPSLAPMRVELTLAHLSGASAEEMAADESALRAAALGRRVGYVPWDAPAGLRLEGVCTSVEVDERSAGRLVLRVALTCDPAWYGEARSARLPAGAASLAVGGNWPSAPVLRLTASGGARVSASNAATGESVSTASAVAAGAAVVLDMGAMTATVGGSPAPVTLGSDFWSLRPGAQSVTVSGASGTIEWEERWA